MTEASDSGGLPPVVRKFSVQSPAEKAFAAFTEHIGEWWPSDFSASGDDLAGVTIEPEAGGRVYETSSSGSQVDWGSVRAIEPGRRIVMAWGLGLGGKPSTEVEVEFTDADGGTEVAFEHRGWAATQRHDRAKFDDPGGWDVVLDDYRAFAAG